MQYNKIDAINNTGMSFLYRSPAHYLEWVLHHGEESHSPALSFGIALHKAVLEPMEFKKEYQVLPSTYMMSTPAQKAAVTKAAKKNLEPGMIALPFADWEAIQAMVKNISSTAFYKELFGDGCEVEAVHTWLDSDSGAPCKGRLDIISNDGSVVCDIKTTQNASPKDFKYSVHKYNLDRQAAFYLDGTGAKEFYWIAVEKLPPYGVAIYKATNQLIEQGRSKYKPLVALYKKCIDSDAWPCYDTNVISSIGTYNSTDVIEESSYEWE